VTGQDPNGNTHTDDDTAEVGQIAPSIAIVKTVGLDSNIANSSDFQYATNGQIVTYFFVVSNTGNIGLTNVVVTDPLIPYTNVVGNLAAGQSVTVSVTDAVSGSLTNVATVTGEDPNGNTHTDDDTAEIGQIAPSISIVKTVSDNGTYPGGNLVVNSNGTTVTYWFVVSNSGDIALTNVTLSDLDIPFSTNLGSLAVGQAVTVSVNDVISANLTNTATVTGKDPNGNSHSASDTAEVRQIMIISGSVFVDVNSDGLFDPEDTNGLGGVSIVLLDATTNVIAVTVTAPNGSYRFTNLLSGSYTVVEIDPPGYYSTGDVVPPNDNRIPVTLISGINVTGRDFLDAQNPNPSITKSFVSATELDTNGNFVVTYNVTVINPAVSAVVYDLSDTPDPDSNVTINGGTVSGFTNLTLVGAGPYILANDSIVAANSTNTYTITLNATLASAVLNGLTNVTSCNTGVNGFSANEGLYNEVTITFGTNNSTITTNTCGNIPPWIILEKNFVSASAPDTNGFFTVGIE
jgi:uncharacterized repeat protein (TIGR01451 family)